MRRTSLALALLALSTAATAASQDFPKRKPGLWEMKTSMMEMGGFGPQMQMCVGDKSDELLAQPGNDDASCSQKKFSRSGERMTFDAVCTMEGRTATIHAVFTGDFNTRYSGEIKTTYNPPLEGMTNATIKQEGRWLGPCKAGQKPGDVSVQGMPGMGGGSFNIDEMMKNVPRQPAAR